MGSASPRTVSYSPRCVAPSLTISQGAFKPATLPQPSAPGSRHVLTFGLTEHWAFAWFRTVNLTTVSLPAEKTRPSLTPSTIVPLLCVHAPTSSIGFALQFPTAVQLHGGPASSQVFTIWLRQHAPWHVV